MLCRSKGQILKSDLQKKDHFLLDMPLGIPSLSPYLDLRTLDPQRTSICHNVEPQFQHKEIIFSLKGRKSRPLQAFR